MTNRKKKHEGSNSSVVAIDAKAWEKPSDAKDQRITTYQWSDSQQGLAHVCARRMEPFLEDAPEVPAYLTTVRKFDSKSIGLAEAAACHQLLKSYGDEVAFWIRVLMKGLWRPYCIGNAYRDLRDKIVQLGSDKRRKTFSEREKRLGADEPFMTGTHNPPLQARQWKMALQQASNIVENYWKLIESQAWERIRKKKWCRKLDKDEAGYVRVMLKRLTPAFFQMLEGRNPALKSFPKLTAKIRGKLCQRMRRVLRKLIKRTPQRGENRSVWFDSSCYDVIEDANGTQRIRLMSCVKSKRIELTLKGHAKVAHTVVLVRADDGQLCLHVPRVPIPKTVSLPDVPRGAVSCYGFDMGFTEVWTCSNGKRFGMGLGALIKAFDEEMGEWVKKRNELQSLANNTQDPKKRRNIEKFNLGRGLAFGARMKQWKARIRDMVNAAINEMVKTCPADVWVVESLGHLFRFDKISRRTRSYLSKWLRGVIRERLELKAAMAGIKIAFVPASYSSQRCSRCGHVEHDNRHGDRFVCKHCGWRGDADINAAVNLVHRAGCGHFRPYMTKEEVLLVERKDCVQRCRDLGIAAPEKAVNAVKAAMVA